MADRLRMRLTLLPLLLAGCFAVPATALAGTAEAIHRDFPTWSAFPAPPEKIPTAGQIKAEVLDLDRLARRLQATADGLPWELNDPEGMAKGVRARIDPIMGAPITEGPNTAAVDAFAARLRAKATPPPIAR